MVIRYSKSLTICSSSLIKLIKNKIATSQLCSKEVVTLCKMCQKDGVFQKIWSHDVGYCVCLYIYLNADSAGWFYIQINFN